MARLPPFLDQKEPLEQDVFGDLENPMVEHRAHLVREPVIQLGAAVWFANKLDAKTDLGKCYGTDVKLIKWAPGNKIDDFGFRFRAAQSGQNIRIEKPCQPPTFGSRCYILMAWLLDTNVLSELRRPKPEPRVVDFVAKVPARFN